MWDAIRANWPYIVGGAVAALFLGLVPMEGRASGAAAAAVSMDDTALIARWDGADEHCRGDRDFGTPRHDMWCTARDLTERVLVGRGWKNFDGYDGGWVSPQQLRTFGLLARGLDAQAQRKNASQQAEMVPRVVQILTNDIGARPARTIWANYHERILDWYPNAWGIMSEAILQLGGAQ
jgi:hypothetical protein